MKAIIIQTEEKDRPLRWQDVPDPTFGPEEVLVNIHAAALNRADLMQRAGHYPPPPGASEILGLEMAGEIAAVGKAVTGWQVGDRVCALLSGGGYAGQVSVPHQMLMALPNDWSYEQGAAVPEVFLTAYVNLFMEAGLQSGENVLIHGGASGVGTAGIQLARQTGCRVFITAGTEDKIAYCQQLGAELAVNYRESDFVEQIQTRVEGIDVILDIVGASYLESNLSLLKPKGRLVFIATLSGSRAKIDLRYLMSKRLRLIGSTLRARSLAEKIEIKERFIAQFWDSLLSGTIKPVIDSVYPVEQANEAHEHMHQNKNIGKIILKIR